MIKSKIAEALRALSVIEKPEWLIEHQLMLLLLLVWAQFKLMNANCWGEKGASRVEMIVGQPDSGG